MTQHKQGLNLNPSSLLFLLPVSSIKLLYKLQHNVSCVLRTLLYFLFILAYCMAWRSMHILVQ